jgi:hypothetical protein
MEERSSPDRRGFRWGRAAGLIGAGVIAGGVLAGTLTAGAQSSSSGSSGSSSSTSTASSADRSGPGETLLTGTTAQRVRAAALAAVPGGTIIRVETDSAGSPYEAHMKKADGTEVTVKVDSAFKVTSIEAGHGAKPDSSQSDSSQSG